MFSICSELTPRARVPDTRIPQLLQPWSVASKLRQYQTYELLTPQVLQQSPQVGSLSNEGKNSHKNLRETCIRYFAKNASSNLNIVTKQRMLGLKIFGRAQTFCQRPFAPSRNFCHPGSHNSLRDIHYPVACFNFFCTSVSIFGRCIWLGKTRLHAKFQIHRPIQKNSSFFWNPSPRLSNENQQLRGSLAKITGKLSNT